VTQVRLRAASQAALVTQVRLPAALKGLEHPPKLAEQRDHGRMSAVTVLRRWAWILVLVAGSALYLALLAALEDQLDPRLVPGLILLAGTVVPATFVTLAAARRGQWRAGGTVLAGGAFVGALLGTVVAYRITFTRLLDLDIVELIPASLVEEAAKLIGPALAIGLWRTRRGSSDWLVIGMAIGMGFAALEAMGLAFTTLLNSQGNIGDVEHLLFLRSLISPAANAAWTGLTCGALWLLASRASGLTALKFIGTFIAVVVLHAVWDGLHSLAGYLVTGVVSVAWLFFELYRTRPEPSPESSSESGSGPLEAVA
jgi:RsiW-degrading membrane proteinase PrsW (M82 family)